MISPPLRRGGKKVDGKGHPAENVAAAIKPIADYEPVQVPDSGAMGQRGQSNEGLHDDRGGFPRSIVFSHTREKTAWGLSEHAPRGINRADKTISCCYISPIPLLKKQIGGHMGKILIIIGTILVLAGILLLFKDSLPFLRHFGRLPGDITIERENFSFHFPIVTGIIISIVLSLVLYVINKFR